MYVFFVFFWQVAHLFTCTLLKLGFVWHHKNQIFTAEMTGNSRADDGRLSCIYFFEVRNRDELGLKIGNSAQIFHLQECHWHKKEVEFQWGRSFPTEHLGKEKKKWLVRETSENDKMIQHLQVGLVIWFSSFHHFITLRSPILLLPFKSEATGVQAVAVAVAVATVAVVNRSGHD